MALVLSSVHAENISPPLVVNGTAYESWYDYYFLLETSPDGYQWHYYPNKVKGYGNGGSACRKEFCITTGGMLTNEGYILPTIFRNYQDGQKLQQYNPCNHYPNAYFGEFNAGASCNEDVCIASGYFYTGLSKSPSELHALIQNNNLPASIRPLLAASKDNGQTWTCPADIYSKALPKKFITGKFESTRSASCNNDLCITVGYFSDGERNYPLLAMSNDKGISFSYPQSIYSSLPPTFTSGTLRASSCNEQVCVSVGSFNDNKRSLPLLTLSSDQGMSWHYIEDIYIKRNLPVNYNSGALNDVSCSNGYCVAVGSFTNGNNNYPMILRSVDNGQNWHYIEEVYSPKNLPRAFSKGSLLGVSCNEDICAASGIFENGSNELPLLAVSIDKGEHWRYPENIYSTVPGGSGQLTESIQCTKNVCIAAGFISDGLGFRYPLVATSADATKTWSYPESVRNTLPFGVSGWLGSGYPPCNSNVCN